MPSRWADQITVLIVFKIGACLLSPFSSGAGAAGAFWLFIIRICVLSASIALVIHFLVAFAALFISLRCFASTITLVLVFMIRCSLVRSLWWSWGTGLLFSSCDWTHAAIVELIHVPGEVHNVEFILLTNDEVAHFEHEPVCVSTSVGVYFHHQIILMRTMQIRGVQVAAFKVLVKGQNFVLVDVARQLGLDVLAKVVQNVLRSIFWL